MESIELTQQKVTQKKIAKLYAGAVIAGKGLYQWLSLDQPLIK